MIFADIQLLHYAVDSQISLLHNAAARFDLSAACCSGRQILPLYHAPGSQILPLHHAVGS
jgi:hypothetical protein